MIRITVSESDFDAGLEISKIAERGGGAVASFVGQVRGDKGLRALELEHYPAMTQKSLEAIANQANEHWQLLGITIVHRVGRLAIGDQIVLVCTGSNHRQNALEACSYIMDQLKTVAPFWKKQVFEDGTESWVEERPSDLKAAADWKQ